MKYYFSSSIKDEIFFEQRDLSLKKITKKEINQLKLKIKNGTVFNYSNDKKNFLKLIKKIDLDGKVKLISIDVLSPQEFLFKKVFNSAINFYLYYFIRKIKLKLKLLFLANFDLRVFFLKTSFIFLNLTNSKKKIYSNFKLSKFQKLKFVYTKPYLKFKPHPKKKIKKNTKFIFD
jgi:hypothetical protein